MEGVLRAIILVGPAAIATTVVLNLVDASRLLSLGATLVLCGIAAAIAVARDVDKPGVGYIDEQHAREKGTSPPAGAGT
jgi:pyruvoyl-dependent arginine decarboxylase (PvlArgDC)